MRTKRINIREWSRGCWCTRMVEDLLPYRKWSNALLAYENDCATDSCAPPRISFSEFIIESIKNFVATLQPALLGSALPTHTHTSRISSGEHVSTVCATHCRVVSTLLLFELQRKIWAKKCAGQNGKVATIEAEDEVILMRNKSYRQKRCVKNDAEQRWTIEWMNGRTDLEIPGADGRFFHRKWRQWRRREAK